ncbi:MAG: lamin tail domain-containing protein [Thermoplasmata archaeon]|nr:MAG: lamin tail domain-containing protein [Thermoplasmata archaeon]
MILKEVLFKPSIHENAYVEIYNKDGMAINPTGYKIVCNTEYIIQSGEFLGKANRYVYLINNLDPSFFQKMKASGDNIYLYDTNGSLVDMVGWSSQHGADLTMTRKPDGSGTRDGYDDITSIAAGWQFDQTPTIHLINVFPDAERDGHWGQEVVYDFIIIENKHDNDDVIDISNISQPGGWNVTISDYNGVPLTDSNGNGLPDIFIPAGGQVNFTMMVIVPTDALIGDSETTTITVRSTFNPLFTDNVTMVTTVVLPPPIFQTVTFPVDSFIIPMDDKQNDVLKAFGFIHALLRNGRTIYRIIEPPDVNIFTNSQPGGALFQGGPVLLMPSEDITVNSVHLNFPSVTLDRTIAQITSSRVDIIYKPTNILIIYGQWGHTQDLLSDMEIPYTMVDQTDVVNDPDMLFDYNLIVDDCPGWQGSVPSEVADNLQQIANSGGEIIFTDIALSDMDAVFPGHIPVTSNTDGTWECSVYNLPEFPGQYYGPETLDIYTMSGGRIMDTPTDQNVRIMVDSNNYNGQYRVLAAYFYLGTSIDKMGVVEGFGYHPGDQPPEARILASVFFGNKFVHIAPSHNVIDVEPPTLFIEVDEDNITLNWTQSSKVGLSHYLIYRATSQTGFDFSDPWVNTSQHDDHGVLPLRTTWNDTGAAMDNAPQEFYYIIRVVSDIGDISSTSRTVGKWTKTFLPGVSSFSMPLEPLSTFTADDFTSEAGADYIKFMDSSTHTWIQHDLGEGNNDNGELKLGEGYEVKFADQTTYTFTGMPGAMIMFDDDPGFLGFNYASEARNLAIEIQANGDVNLTWQEPASMGVDDWYEVYYSNSRDGFFGTFDADYFLVDPIINYGVNTTTHTGAQAHVPGTQLYYMVVPFNALGIRGAGTYSIGIWTEEYLAEYDTMGIPLKLESNWTADWYCHSIPETVGINYFVYSQQRWGWHSTRMPSGAYDTLLVMTGGYQISTSNTTKFTFIGI